jgi:ADP-heptose:LPS heptosyltransferase
MQLNELLVGQSYITDVQSSIKKPQDIDVDMNQFRKTFIEWGQGKFNKEEENDIRQIPLTQLYRMNIDNSVPVDVDKIKWIHLDSKVQFESKPIVINRTSRYHRVGFPWKQLVDDYGNHMLFVGTKSEFDEFVFEFGYVKYYPTKRILQLAQVLNGAKLFIGNQSFPYSLVEAMKIPAIQETNSHMVPNCMFVRDDAYLTFTEESINYSLIKDFIHRYI